jgi:hypothetical protein
MAEDPRMIDSSKFTAVKRVFDDKGEMRVVALDGTPFGSCCGCSRIGPMGEVDKITDLVEWQALQREMREGDANVAGLGRGGVQQVAPGIRETRDVMFHQTGPGQMETTPLRIGRRLLEKKPNRQNPRWIKENMVVKENRDYYFYRHELHDDRFGHIIFYYYIPDFSNPQGPSRIVFGIHGAGDEHYTGGNVIMTEWADYADQHNFIIVAPVFEKWYPEIPQGFVYHPGYKRDWWIEPNSQEDRAKYVAFLNANDWIGPEYDPFPSPTPINQNLYDFTWLINNDNFYRADLAVVDIYHMFRDQFDRLQPGINIFGYSGGGQFVCRFMFFHSSLVYRVALGGIGTVMFPDFEINYPYGLGFRYNPYPHKSITQLGVTYQVDDPEKTSVSLFWGLNRTFRKQGYDWADWMTTVSRRAWNMRLATLLKHRIFIFGGTEDYDEDDPDTPEVEWTDRCWQGNGQYEKAANLYAQFLALDRRLKTTFYEPPDGPPRPFREQNAPLDVHFMPLFNMNHDQARIAMNDWLHTHWMRVLPRRRHNVVTCVYANED